MGCGKGRNVIWLAGQGVEVMHGIDFADSAIAEATNRAEEAGVAAKCDFRVHDATTPWPFESDSLDFGIDCFASTDIVSPEGRSFAASEMHRVLRPGGFLLAYLLSPEDEFHKEMIEKSPVAEKNAFVHTTGKFEKTFEESEALALYKDFSVFKKERLDKTTEFFGKSYACHHWWFVFQK
jgi:SAM-dependent methyltransferase